MLHDHHFHLDNPTDQSAVVVYKAAHAILDFIYSISATSYDVSLLDHLALVCPSLFLLGGVVLTRLCNVAGVG